MSEAKSRTYTIERTFNAPRNLVFDMFTKAEHLQKWYGPKNWSLPTSSIDLKEGGHWTYCMESPNGEKQQWGKTDIHEISPPERFVYTEYMTDPEGNAVAGMPQMHITLEFEDQGGKTKVTNSILFTDVQTYEMSIKGGMTKGFDQAYDSLEELLSTIT